MTADLSNGRCAYGTLDLSNAIGRFGLAFTRKICAQAHIGFDEGSPGEDMLALDGAIKYAIADVRVQIKATTRWSLSDTGGPLHLPIEPGWAAKWEMQVNPTFLIAVLMDRTISNWSLPAGGGTHLDAHALWARIDGIDPSSTYVELDRKNRFTSSTIAEWGKLLYQSYGRPA